MVISIDQKKDEDTRQSPTTYSAPYPQQRSNRVTSSIQGKECINSHGEEEGDPNDNRKLPEGTHRRQSFSSFTSSTASADGESEGQSLLYHHNTPTDGRHHQKYYVSSSALEEEVIQENTDNQPDEELPDYKEDKTGVHFLPRLWTESKKIASMAWPVSLGYEMQLILGMSSIFSLGHVGTTELASIALANMFCNVTGYSVGIGLASALDTLGSQSYTGSPDPHSLGKHTQRSIMIMAFLTLPISLLWAFSDQLLLLAGQDPEIARLSALFSFYMIPGLFPYLVNECLKRYLQCQGIMKANMFVIMIAAPINIFLQWLLVWSSWSIGSIGASVATSITNALLPILSIVYIIYFDGSKAWGGWKWSEALSWRELWVNLKLGIPGAAMMCSEWWAFEVVALLAGLLGEEALASQTVILSTATLTYAIPLGISIASSTCIGNYLGANKKHAARYAAYGAICISLLCALMNATLLISIRGHWGYLWSNDAKVISLIAQILPLAALFQVNDGLSAVGGGILRGCGRQQIGAWINLTGYYFIALPLAALLSIAPYFRWGLVGLWVGLTSGLLVVSMIQMVIITRMDWEREAQRALALVREHSSVCLAVEGIAIDEAGLGSREDEERQRLLDPNFSEWV